MISRKTLTSLVLGASALSLSAIPSNVLAEEKVNPFYFKAGVGMGWTSDVEGDFTSGGTKYNGKYGIDDASTNFGFGIGKEINDWRLELDYNQNTVKSDSLSLTTGGNGVTASMTPDYELDTKSYHLNLIKDFNKNDTFTPYLGFGVGFTNIDSDAQTLTVAGTAVALESESKTVLSYNITGGISYNINNTSSIFTEATLLRTSEFDIDDVSYDAVSQTRVLGGVRFRF